jgi:hypothetical protein
MDVTSINNGDYLKVSNVDFGTGALSFDARVAASGNGGSIELHLDTQTGPLLGTCAVSGTGGAQTWTTKSCAISGATAVHDLYLKFTGASGALFNFNWWKFTARDGALGGGGGGGTGGGPSGGGGGGSGAGGADAGLPAGAGGSSPGMGGAVATGGGQRFR